MKMLFEREKLLDKLKTMKNYFLLGDGQFFQIFAEEASSLMALPPTANAENEVNHFPYATTKLRLGYDQNDAK